MAQQKFRVFELTMIDGSKVIAKSPASKLTEKYAEKLAWHWAGVKQNEVVSIKGIE